MEHHPQSLRDDADGILRRYEYDDETVLVADVGASEGTVDVVDETAIVVVDDEQYELEVPGGASRAIMNNGIVTVEVR